MLNKPSRFFIQFSDGFRTSARFFQSGFYFVWNNIGEFEK